MTVMTYQSWPSLASQIHKEMNKILERGFRPDESDSSTIATSQWAPAVDIKEEPDKFVLLADIPGVEPKDIHISMENGILTVKGERVMSKEEKTDNYFRTERVHGEFYRRFSLPDTADSENIKAKGKNGVLEIVIPKKPENKPRKIDIQVEQ